MKVKRNNNIKKMVLYWCLGRSFKTIVTCLDFLSPVSYRYHFSGFVSSCATNPIWLIKTRLQLDRSHASLPSVIRRIHAEGGVKGFWKGLTASWWGISETMIHFVIYEYLKKCLAQRQERDRGRRRGEERTALDFMGFMACGAISKTCATCVAYPHGRWHASTSPMVGGKLLLPQC